MTMTMVNNNNPLVLLLVLSPPFAKTTDAGNGVRNKYTTKINDTILKNQI